MAKTVKCEIYIGSMETTGLSIPISKKEFERQLKHYKAEIVKNHERLKDDITKCEEDGRSRDNVESYIEDIEPNTKEEEKYIETSYAIHDYGTDIILYKREAKPGYHWK